MDYLGEIRKPARSLRGSNGYGGGKKTLYFLALTLEERLLEGNIPLQPDTVVGIIPHGGKIFQCQIGIIYGHFIIVA
jgi:hypothetical protein